MKRVFTLVLVCVMLCTMLPQITLTANAAEEWKTWSQSDSRWGSKRLGNSNSRMDVYGCLVTAVAKIMVQSGFVSAQNFNPGVLVDWLNNNNSSSEPSFTASGELCYAKPTEMTSGLTFVDHTYGTSNGITGNSSNCESKIMELVQKNYHIILKVPSDRGHYVAVDNETSLKTNRVYIMDNGTNGNALLVDRYSQVYQIVLYSGWTDEALANITCSHNYSNIGVCSNCNVVYNWASTFSVDSAGIYEVSLSGGICLRTDKPYAESTEKAELIKDGTQVEVLGSVMNAVGTEHHIWYKVSYCNTVGYTSENNLTFVDYFPQAITGTITSPAEGATIPQANYTLKGTITSTRYPIRRIDAFVDGNYLTGVTLENCMEYALEGSAIDTAMRFQDLTPGQHRITIQARDIHRSTMTDLCTRYFYTEGSTNYTVSFSDTGSITMDSITVAQGNSVMLPDTIPERFGYNFYAWATEPSGPAMYYYPGDVYTPSEDTTLYAIWTAANHFNVVNSRQMSDDTVGGEVFFSFTVAESGIYQLNGNTSGLDTMGYLYDANQNLLKSDDDSGGNYQFQINQYLTAGNTYWLRVAPYNASYTGTIYAGIDKLSTELTVNSTANAVITNGGQSAFYKFIPITSGEYVIYSTSTEDTKVYLHDPINNIQLATDDDGGLDYNFRMRYYMTAGTPYNISVQYLNTSKTGTIPITFGEVYTISYDANGGTGAPAAQKKDYRTDIMISETIPTRDGYTFMGWATNIIMGVNILPGDTLSDNSDYALHAVWQRNTSALIENATYSVDITQGGEMAYFTYTPGTSGEYAIFATGSDDTIVYLYDAGGTELVSDDDSGDGTNFRLAYYLTAGTQYTYGVRYYSSSKTGTIPFTFCRVYTISYNANGGTGAPASQKKDYGTDITISETIPTRDGCAFMGWATSSSATTATYQPGATWTGNRNATLYAVWKENTITGGCGESLTWTLVDGVLTISGNGTMSDYGTGAQPWCDFRDSITELIVENGVTTIGAQAFEEMYALKKISLPETLKTIGAWAFYECTGLTAVTIPNSVTEIDYAAFYNCTNLNTMTISDGVQFFGGSWADDCNIQNLIIADGATFVDSKLIDNFYNILRTVVISDTVTTIDDNAFYKCENLTAVTIGDSVTTIGGYAFSDCTSLTAIDIPDSVTTIGDYAFYECTSLTTVTIGDGVTTIGNEGFFKCDSLTNVTVGDSVTTIGDCVFFECTSLTAIDIPDSVTAIGTSAFENCTGLSSVTIGNGVTAIGDCVFFECTSLTAIDIPDSVTTIGTSAFKNCTGLSSVTIGNGVTAIGDAAFYCCTGLTSVSIPNSVTTIGSSAFWGCTNLNTMTISDSVQSFGWYWVDDCNLQKLIIADGATTVDEHLIGAFIKEELKYVVISDTVTTIDEYAFRNCTDLTSVTIPDSVTTIGNSAFRGCTGLTDVYFGGDQAAWDVITVGTNNTPLTNATLHITQTPVEENAIVANPQPVTTDSENTVTFCVETSGIVESYQWQYRKLYKWFDTSMEGYNTDTLTVPATGARNGYDYRCVITFADGTVLTTEPAELTVKTYLTVTGQPNDQTVVLGSKGQFTASAEGEGIQYQWQYKRPGSDLWIDTAMEGATKPTVLIETTKARDGYQYRCKITDVTGNESFTEAATMRVLSFTDHPDEAFAATNATVKFSVATSVEGGFTYQWQYRRSATAAWTNTTMTGYNTATLTVSATKARNGYEYRCVLTGSKNSKIESKAAVLHVGDPVVITAQPANKTVSAGQVATFTVTATNAYSYQWQYQRPTGTTWSNTSADGNQTATLNVTTKASNNGYKYRCIITGLDGTEYITDIANLTIG